MKKILTLILSIYSLGLFSQLTPGSTEKICIEGEVSNLLYIENVNDVIVASVNYPGKIVGIDANNGNTLWTKNITTGYGLRASGNSILFSRNANQYDDKTSKTVYKEWLYTLDPLNGNYLDSTQFNFNIVSLSRSTGLTDNLAMIISKGTFQAVIVNKKTGEIKFNLFSESTDGNMPNSIQTDPSGKYVAVGCANGSKGFLLFDFNTGKQVLNLTGEGDIHAIAFTSDSKYCLYVQNRKLKIVNTATLKLEKEITLSNDTPLLAIHPDNENLVLCGYGNSVQLTFLNWKTEKSQSGGMNTKGGIPVFTSKGDLFLPFQNGVQCFVDKTKLPYLAKMKFGNSTTSNSQNSTVTQTGFSIGQRVYILYTADNKYYSGVIINITNDSYEVIFDDNTKTTVKSAQLKTLPAIKVGDTIQVKRSDNKFYSGKVLEIKGEILLVQYSNASEWVTSRNVMQVE